MIFPEGKLTKGQLADYYETVAPIMLPWAGSRPISLVRCPQGRAKKCFFQKHDAGSFGDAVKQVGIREKDGHQEAYLFVDTPAGLLACVQMGTIEFHGWGARIEDVEKADRLVFDLDPDESLGFKVVVSAALHVRDLLAEMGLTTFPMMTGGKGVHVIAPLTPSAEWRVVKDFANRFAMALEQSEPARFTAALSKAKRTGRIFIDYLRNQRGATAVMPYSARNREHAPIAVPVTWEELRDLGKALFLAYRRCDPNAKACIPEKSRALGEGGPIAPRYLKCGSTSPGLAKWASSAAALTIGLLPSYGRAQILL